MVLDPLHSTRCGLPLAAEPRNSNTHEFSTESATQDGLLKATRTQPGLAEAKQLNSFMITRCCREQQNSRCSGAYEQCSPQFFLDTSDKKHCFAPCPDVFI